VGEITQENGQSIAALHPVNRAEHEGLGKVMQQLKAARKAIDSLRTENEALKAVLREKEIELIRVRSPLDVPVQEETGPLRQTIGGLQPDAESKQAAVTRLRGWGVAAGGPDIGYDESVEILARFYRLRLIASVRFV
jgi:hypothetical protein